MKTGFLQGDPNGVPLTLIPRHTVIQIPVREGQVASEVQLVPLDSYRGCTSNQNQTGPCRGPTQAFSSDEGGVLCHSYLGQQSLWIGVAFGEG